MSSLLLDQVSKFLGVSPWLSLSVLDLRLGQSRERFGEPNRLPNIARKVPCDTPWQQ